MENPSYKNEKKEKKNYAKTPIFRIYRIER